MVNFAVATVILVQVTMLAQTTVALPIESEQKYERRDSSYSRLSKRDPMELEARGWGAKALLAGGLVGVGLYALYEHFKKKKEKKKAAAAAAAKGDPKPSTGTNTGTPTKTSTNTGVPTKTATNTEVPTATNTNTGDPTKPITGYPKQQMDKEEPTTQGHEEYAKQGTDNEDATSRDDQDPYRYEKRGWDGLEERGFDFGDLD